MLIENKLWSEAKSVLAKDNKILGKMDMSVSQRTNYIFVIFSPTLSRKRLSLKDHMNNLSSSEKLSTNSSKKSSHNHPKLVSQSTKFNFSHLTFNLQQKLSAFLFLNFKSLRKRSMLPFFIIGYFD